MYPSYGKEQNATRKARNAPTLLLFDGEKLWQDHILNVWQDSVCFKAPLCVAKHSSVASPICQEGLTFLILAFSSRFYLFFSIFFLIFLRFFRIFPLPLFPDFGNFFAVKGGTLPPLCPYTGYATGKAPWEGMIFCCGSVYYSLHQCWQSNVKSYL